MRAHLHQCGANDDFAVELVQHLAGDGARRNAHGGLPRRLAAAAAIIAHAIFGVIGIVGMTGAVFVPDLGIVFGALIHIFDQQSDRCAGGQLLCHPFVLEDAGENFHRVRFLALGDEFRLTWAPPLQIALDIGFAEGDAGRAAIHHAADGRPVAFAEGGDAKQMPERIVRHKAR